MAEGPAATEETARSGRAGGLRFALHRFLSGYENGLDSRHVIVYSRCPLLFDKCGGLFCTRSRPLGSPGWAAYGVASRRSQRLGFEIGVGDEDAARREPRSRNRVNLALQTTDPRRFP